MGITQIKKTEEVLRIWGNTIESSIYAIALVDFNGILVYVNPSFLKLWGYNNEKKVLGISSIKFWKEEKEALQVLQILQDKGSWKGELEAKKKDGSFFTVYLSANKISDENNKAFYFMASFIDITKQKRAEAALKESEEIYKALLKTSPDGVVVLDLDGIIADVSMRTVELFGFKSTKDFIGKSAFDFISPGEHKKAAANLEKTLKQGLTKNVQLTLLKRDGSQFVGNLNAALIKDAYGQPKSFLITGREIIRKRRRASNINVPKPAIMTVSEVADYMRVHSSTIYRLVRENKIPAIKVGNQWRFRKNLIDKWLGKKVVLDKKESALK